jgi:hypothetical protein
MDRLDKFVAANTQHFAPYDRANTKNWFLGENESAQHQFKLEKSKEYRLIACGDRDVDEIIAEVYAKGKLLAASKAARDVELAVSASEDHSYTVRLTLKKSRDSVPCMCAAVVLERKSP